MLAFDPEIRDQAYQFFIQEALEFLQILEDGLLTLQQDHSVAKIHTLMRAAHSIKGGAASVGLPAIQQLAHHLEDGLRTLYREDVEIDFSLEETLLQVYDCLRAPLLAQIQVGCHDEAAALQQAEPALAQLRDRLGDALLEVNQALPTAAELGVDIVQAIFRGDVQEGIMRLAAVLQQPLPPTLHSELRAQIEVFIGVGELLNLPGFTAIARTTLAALQWHPDRAEQIGKLALANLQAAQAAVLAGDRTQGGAPSEPLQQLAAGSDNAPLAPAIEGLGDLPDLASLELEAIFGETCSAAEETQRKSELDELELESGIIGPPDLLPDSFPTELEPIDITELESLFNEGVGSAEPFPGLPEWQGSDLESQPQVASDSASTPVSLETEGTVQVSGLQNLLAEISVEGTDILGLDNLLREVPLDAADLSEVQSFFQDLAAGPEASLEDMQNLIPGTEMALLPPQAKPAADATTRTGLLPLSDNSALPIVSTTVMPVEDAGTASRALFQPAATPPLASDRARPSVTASRSQATAEATPYLAPTVRVELARLERLNNLVGELVTQENGSVLQTQQLQSVVSRVVRRFERFEALSRNLETWSDRSQNTRARLVASTQTHPGATTAVSESYPQPPLPLEEFDPLQLDVYSDLYTLVQETREEIAQVGEAMQDMVLLMQQAHQLQRHKQQTLKQVRNDLLWARMLPLGDVLQRFPRMVRDLASRYGKQVNLKLTGVSTLVDKALLEKLYDPLVHLMRNAFDHGIEPPLVRQQTGKPPEGTIEIRAYHRGNQTYIEVRDDGRGVDLETVRARAVALQLVSAEVAATLTPEQVYEFVFAAGLSTAEQVSSLSGRGMGLDAVQLQIHRLKGSIAIQSEIGRGTMFTLRLPLTLTVAKLLVFSVNTHLMAVPIDALVEIIMAAPDQIQIVQGQPFFQWQDELIPIYSPSVFIHNYLPIKPTSEQLQAMALPQSGRLPLLLIAGESQFVALQVEQILQEQELAIKPFGPAVTPPPYLYGCTILGDGSLVPVIDGPTLVNTKQPFIQPNALEQKLLAQEAPLALAAAPGAIAEKPVTLKTTVLVVDDSLTTRQNLALTLKKAGYQVMQARDGREALEQLQRTPQIDAIFSDVEMPRMNGFEFLSHCRQKFPKSALPVIMLSSRSSEKHRQVARLMGATDYLTKPYLEQELLQMLQVYLQSATN